MKKNNLSLDFLNGGEKPLLVSRETSTQQEYIENNIKSNGPKGINIIYNNDNIIEAIHKKNKKFILNLKNATLLRDQKETNAHFYYKKQKNDDIKKKSTLFNVSSEQSMKDGDKRKLEQQISFFAQLDIKRSSLPIGLKNNYDRNQIQSQSLSNFMLLSSRGPMSKSNLFLHKLGPSQKNKEKSQSIWLNKSKCASPKVSNEQLNSEYQQKIDLKSDEINSLKKQKDNLNYPLINNEKAQLNSDFKDQQCILQNKRLTLKCFNRINQNTQKPTISWRDSLSQMNNQVSPLQTQNIHENLKYYTNDDKNHISDPISDTSRNNLTNLKNTDNLSMINRLHKYDLNLKSALNWNSKEQVEKYTSMDSNRFNMCPSGQPSLLEEESTGRRIKQQELEFYKGLKKMLKVNLKPQPMKNMINPAPINNEFKSKPQVQQVSNIIEDDQRRELLSFFNENRLKYFSKEELNAEKFFVTRNRERIKHMNFERIGIFKSKQPSSQVKNFRFFNNDICVNEPRFQNPLETEHAQLLLQKAAKQLEISNKAQPHSVDNSPIDTKQYPISKSAKTLQLSFIHFLQQQMHYHNKQPAIIQVSNTLPDSKLIQDKSNILIRNQYYLWQRRDKDDKIE